MDVKEQQIIWIVKNMKNDISIRIFLIRCTFEFVSSQLLYSDMLNLNIVTMLIITDF